MIAPTLNISVKSNIYNSLWLKYVTGFNPRYHCQKCLKGPLSKKFKYDKDNLPIPESKFYLNEHRSPYLYICGITNSYHRNLHLAFKPSLNTTIRYTTPDIEIFIENAREIKIEMLDLPFPKEYKRCRNFQFGYQYFKLINNELL